MGKARLSLDAISPLAESSDSLRVVTGEDKDDVDVHEDVESPLLSSRTTSLGLLVLRVGRSSVNKERRYSIYMYTIIQTPKLTNYRSKE